MVAMARRPFTHGPTLLRRFKRAEWLRAALAVVMVPIMVVGIFGGTTILAHSHDGHHTHVHAALTEAAARIVAAQHITAHRAGTPCGLDAPHLAHADAPHDHPPVDPNQPPSAPHGPDPEHVPAPGDTIVLIPDIEQIVVRAVELGPDLTAAGALPLAHHGCTPPSGPAGQLGSPGGHLSAAPWHLCALTSGQRLLRTSQAMLI